MKVLVVGSGGREHALACKLSESNQVSEIFVAPGNYGTQQESKCTNVNIAETDIESLVSFAKKNEINLTVVGPELPLSLGIVDYFQRNNLKIFGPTKEGAKIETSKWFAKTLMLENNIPTAKACYLDGSKGIDNMEINKGSKFLSEMTPPYVVKADGLYSGKGVVVTNDYNEALNTIKKFLSEQMNVVLEEYLEGEEISLLAFTDGNKVLPLLPSQDYKRAYDNDQGPNTGGMGAYAPVSKISKEFIREVTDSILEPTIKSMDNKGISYHGVLYAGLILTETGPKVLEYNARFGDPETQTILPLLSSDLYEILEEVANGKIIKDNLEWKEQRAVCVVLASRGYPKEYKKGFTIDYPSIQDSNVKIYLAGVSSSNSSPVTSGGRVISVTGIDETIAKARCEAYKNVNKIEYFGKQFRGDIALTTLK
ncbi:phosphoribosylamine--glycine ligase [Natranaerobius trueperi]|uniref:Phosphoribosylamine--glycine ligase n=1 Tax=Natranaerobius trueperi TaxID=759412 RepID=A0A226C2V6_9FIRM|nr:phosphoribosylamine--glycine ligase [Natranaerobius trueperi]OWZ84737.1 phosphoribosylamine--glycine ligase [Natranaerobius trueperi]